MPYILAACLSLVLTAAAFGQDNTWINPNLRFVLPSGIAGAEWRTGDGYCTALARSANGSILWRSGVGQNSSVSHPKLDPGFYSNAILEWTPSTDSARVIDIFNWDGGSYSDFYPLPAFSTDTTPVPRHTYDGLAYVEEQNALYLMLGAYGRGAPDSGLAQELYRMDDSASTWKFTFSDGKWRRIQGSIRRFWPSVYTVSNYESHLRCWPAGHKLLFVDDRGQHHAEFDLSTETWTNVSASGLQAPFSLYNARSAWDSQRDLWVFRNGKNVCMYDPSTRTYVQLPDIRPDTARGRGIAYDSRHDVYIAPIVGTTSTAVYSPSGGAWTEIAGSVTLPDAWAAYDSLSDWVCYVNQHNVLKFRYNPATVRVQTGGVLPAPAEITATPNPFKAAVKIAVSGQRIADSDIQIAIYDIEGKMIKRLSATSYQLSAGLTWSAAGLPSGLYIVQVKTGGKILTRRVVLQR